MFCKKCGYKLRENGFFCENCGTRFSKNDSKEIYNNYEVFYKKNRIKNFPKILIAAYIIEFTAIIIACIFPVYICIWGIGNSELKQNYSIKFFVIAILFLFLSIITKKKLIFHVIINILYFIYPFFNFFFGKSASHFTIFYYISAALMLISLIIVIIYGIYRRKQVRKNNIEVL